MGNFPQELTRQAEKEPIVANRVDRPPCRQCRFGYISCGVDSSRGKKTNGRETSQRSAVLGEFLREFTQPSFPTQAARKPSAAK